MKINYLIAGLLLSNLSYSQLSSAVIRTEKNTLTTAHSNDSPKQYTVTTAHRTIDYPTQIVRITAALNQQLNCTEVNQEIDRVFIQHISKDKFIYTTYVVCQFDPETHRAITFTLSSYFDPINDEAVDYLNKYLAQYNGTDLLGTPLAIESAKAMILALNFSAGVKKNPDNPPFIEFREDQNNYCFKSNYEMRTQLYPDMQKNFYSNDPDKILPFLDRWLFAHASKVYKPILRDANYLRLKPEKIFLMDSGEQLFVSGLKHHFLHSCSTYDNQHCLKSGV